MSWLDEAIGRVMVEAISDIGHVTGKKTIAEFVENRQIVNALREIGVDYGQGSALARPVPFGSTDLTLVTRLNAAE